MQLLFVLTNDEFYSNLSREVFVCIVARTVVYKKRDFPLEEPRALIYNDAYQIPSAFCEASSTFGMAHVADLHIGMNTFGASAPNKDCMEHFGFTPEKVARRIVISFFD